MRYVTESTVLLTDGRGSGGAVGLTEKEISVREIERIRKWLFNAHTGQMERTFRAVGIALRPSRSERANRTITFRSRNTVETADSACLSFRFQKQLHDWHNPDYVKILCQGCRGPVCWPIPVIRRSSSGSRVRGPRFEHIPLSLRRCHCR